METQKIYVCFNKKDQIELMKHSLLELWKSSNCTKRLGIMQFDATSGTTKLFKKDIGDFCGTFQIKSRRYGDVYDYCIYTRFSRHSLHTQSGMFQGVPLLEDIIFDDINLLPIQRSDFIAEIRHAIWVGFQMGAGQEYNEEMNDAQYKSLLDGIKFSDNNPDATPEENHDNWMKEKEANGWIYGHTKDFKKKTHPDMIPYNELLDIEKKKDTMASYSHKIAVKLWKKL